MNPIPQPLADDVDQLLLNARLRDELEPFVDESFSLLALRNMPISAENEFLASMLAWERAPVLPISRWFEPELVLPKPETLDDLQIRKVLWETILRLHSQRIVLEFTDHLSDRQLFCMIYRDILSSFEKKIDLPKNFLHWHCLDDNDTETWLRYYATSDEREQWQQENEDELPEVEEPPFPRQMPRRPGTSS
jgi:hypothetical protein